MAQTWVEIAAASPVLEETIVSLGLPLRVSTLRSMVSISAPPDTQILVIDVEDSDPARAADIANTIGEVFINQNQVRESLRYAEPIATWQSRMDVIASDIGKLEITINGSGELKTAEEIALLA